MQCDLCGKVIDSPILVSIENVEMEVCQGCSRYGKKIQKKKPIKKASTDDTRKIFEKVVNKRELIQMIADDYPERVKKGREKLGFKQIELAMKLSERESLINNIEKGKHKPTMEIARKLEKILDIKLVEEHIEEHKNSFKKTPSQKMTLGDFIKIKKR